VDVFFSETRYIVETVSTSVSARLIAVRQTTVAGHVIAVAVVTKAGQAADAVPVVKGDGRVHGRTALADWREVDVTIGSVDAVYTQTPT